MKDDFTCTVGFDAPEFFEGWELVGLDLDDDGHLIWLDYSWLFDDTEDQVRPERISVQLFAHPPDEQPRHAGDYWLRSVFLQKRGEHQQEIQLDNPEESFDDPQDAVDALFDRLRNGDDLVETVRGLR